MPCARAELIALVALMLAGRAAGEPAAEAPASVPPASAPTEPPVDEFDLSTTAVEATARETNRLIVPVPLVTPQYGAALGVAAVWFYTPRGAVRPWVTGGGAIASSNGSYGAAAVHQMSLRGDALRLEFRAGYGRLNSQFFGIGGDDEAESIAIRQTPALAEARGAVRVSDAILLGARARFLDMQTEVRDPEAVPPGADLSQLENYRQVALGPTFTYDRTDQAFNPRRGTLIASHWMFSLPALGSDSAYNKLIVNASHFIDANPRTVVALRGSLCSASSNAPFFDLCLYGASANLRGYESGRFRDQASWSAQAELRRALGGRFGAVAFAGIGGIAPGLDRLGEGPFLPAAGAGLRYVVAPDYGVNLRLDAAVGRDGTAVYVSLGEAF